MRHSLLAAAVVSLVAAACANPLGAGVPDCDPSELSSSMLVQIQSVQEARYVSCIHGLKTGWDYWSLQARSDRTSYYLDSDRMGFRFLVVDVLPSCDPGGAIPATTPAYDDAEDVTLFKDVDADTTIRVVLVPERPSEETTRRALDILSELRDTEIEDRIVEASVSTSDEPTARRIEEAAASGAHVIAISIRDVEEGSLTLRLAGTTNEVSVSSLDRAIETIEDAVPPPSYRGKWFFVFEGGCIIYTFNAMGPGVATIEDDVELTLGLFDAEALREIARSEGFEI